MADPTAKVCTLIQMVQCSQANFTWANQLDREMKFGLTVPLTQGSTFKAANMARENSCGLKGTTMKEILDLMIYTVVANMCGAMAVSLRASGGEIKSMARVHLHGPMDVSIKESTKMIRNMVMAFSVGRMAVGMKDSGGTDNNMETVFTQTVEGKCVLAIGKMAGWKDGATGCMLDWKGPLAWVQE